jgi:type II secretory pathway component PulJ
MKRFIAIAVAAVGGVIAFQCLPRGLRDRLTSGAKDRIREHMKQIMAGLPEDAPPKLVMSVLPKLQAQNDQIIAMLQEQSRLLREQQHTSVSGTAA